MLAEEEGEVDGCTAVMVPVAAEVEAAADIREAVAALMVWVAVAEVVEVLPY